MATTTTVVMTAVVPSDAATTMAPHAADTKSQLSLSYEGCF